MPLFRCYSFLDMLRIEHDLPALSDYICYLLNHLFFFHFI